MQWKVEGSNGFSTGTGRGTPGTKLVYGRKGQEESYARDMFREGPLLSGTDNYSADG